MDKRDEYINTWNWRSGVSARRVQSERPRSAGKNSACMPQSGSQ